MTVPLAGLFMTTILQRLSASIVAKEECTTVRIMISSYANTLATCSVQLYEPCSNCPAIAEDTFCAGAGDSAPCFGYMWGDAGWVW